MDPPPTSPEAQECDASSTQPSTPLRESDDSSASSSKSIPEARDGDLCPDCDLQHLPRRLVICVDGTWMAPDGSVASPNGNATNMFRIWCMTREGKVTDSSGKSWLQIRAPFVDGVGAVDDYIERIYSGLTGSGFELKVMEVYKYCCAMCPKDDIFMFGFSRGAFIVRAVAGLLHHMRSLKTDSDFEAKFLKGLREYRAARDKSKLSENSVSVIQKTQITRSSEHLSENTRSPPCVKFLGLIDTVKALDDDNGLYAIDMVLSVRHVRHALALFERRAVMLPERLDMNLLLESDPQNHSVQEAWFAGTHGNMGGAQAQDGLALWPLHWLATEAQKQGFAVGFRKLENSNVIDPAALIKIRPGDPQMECVCHNGIRTLMSDFNSTTEMAGFFPWIDTGGGTFPSPEEFRAIYQDGKLIGDTSSDTSGCFVHPSVFLLDNTDVNVVEAINICPFSNELRKEQQFTKFPDHKMFWALQKELGVRTQAEKPRILVCGQVNAGKSSLIDAVLDRQTVSRNLAHEHFIIADILKTIRSLPHRMVFALDSMIPMSHSNPRRVKLYSTIVEDLRPALNLIMKTFRAFSFNAERSHISRNRCTVFGTAYLTRIQKSDEKFSKLDFASVPLILVFTKTDKLRGEKKSEALKEYNKRRGTRLNLEDLGSVAPADKQSVLERAEELLLGSKQTLESQWTARLPIFSSVVFVESPDYSGLGPESVTRLLQYSNTALTSELVGKMHANAQEAFMKPKLDETVSRMLHLCDRKGDFWTCLTTFKAEVYRRELMATAIQTAASIFQLEGFRNTALTSTLIDILWPLKSSGSSVVGSQAIGGMALGAAIATVKLIPLVALVSVPLTVGASARSSLKQSSGLVFSCVEVILIFDRLFWFGDKHIEEYHVTAAALHYLKVRPQVLAALEKSIPITKDIVHMGPAITSVLDKYRYRRQKLQEEKRNSGHTD